MMPYNLQLDNDNTAIWVKYDDVDFLKLQDVISYEQDINSLNVFFESLEQFVLTNKKNIFCFIVFSSGCFLMLRVNPVLAKEITNNYLKDNPDFPFKVYDFRPIKVVPKKVIQNIQKISESDITISVNILDFFKKPPLKVIEAVNPNLKQLVLKSTTAGLTAGLGLNLGLRGGNIIGWASSFAIKKLLEMVKKRGKESEKDDPSMDKILESVFLKEDNSTKKLPVNSSKSNFAQQAWFALLNPKVGGPFVMAILIFLISDHFHTEHQNKNKWGPKRVSVAEKLNIPLPLPQQKKKKYFLQDNRLCEWTRCVEFNPPAMVIVNLFNVYL